MMKMNGNNKSIIIAALVSCATAAVLFTFFYASGLFRDTSFIQFWMRGFLISCVLLAACVFCLIKKMGDSPKEEPKETVKEKQFITIVAAVIAMGIIMRIGYMLYTPYDLRGHDVGLGSNGHADYVLTLMQGHLPDSNEYQYYHPPLFHILAAVMSATFSVLTGEQDVEILLEAGKLVSCWSSILTLFLSAALCRELKLGKSGTVFVIGVSAFLPEHYLLAGRLNNDALSIMFMTAIIIFTLKWYRRQTMHDMVILAVCYGLGMMTKISAGTFSLVTGTVMIITLYKNLQCGNCKQIIQQYSVFSLIAFPLGLWYPVRNLIRFAQPLTYVAKIEITDPLYCGNHSIISRFLPVVDFNLYADPRVDSNVWSYIVKTSVFGEFKYDVTEWIPQALLICAGMLSIAGVAAMVYRWFHNPSFQEKVLVAFWCVTIISYLWFNLKYPFGCTMDFRYIVPSALICSVFLGKWTDKNKTGILAEMIEYMLWIVIVILGLTSCTMYTMV